MGVLVPIRTLVMALVGRVGHHHVGDLTWAHDDNGGRCLGRVGSVTNTQVTIQKVDV